MYTVTAWVLLALLLGWDTSCGYDKCQNLEPLARVMQLRTIGQGALQDYLKGIGTVAIMITLFRRPIAW